MREIFCPSAGLASNYPTLLRHLYSINDLLKKDGISAPSDASLTNTTRLYDLIGRPLDRIPTLHVGGTNGKGSTSYKLSESLSSCGLRTGLFVSPHLASFRERMQVNAQLISEEAFVTHLPTVLKLCADHSIPATLFELTFILACLHYEKEKCQVVVLEVGLGGELDATNVVNTALSVLCSVSLDHTRILGSTVEEIALKKGGIFKRGVPALVGPGCPLAVLQGVAAATGAELLEVHEVFDRNLKSGLFYRGKSGVDGKRDGERKGFYENGFKSVSFSDTDELNAHIAFSALSILSEKSKIAGDVVGLEGRSGLYSAFSALDLTSEGVQHSLEGRPPCRWERHTVNSTITGNDTMGNMSGVGGESGGACGSANTTSNTTSSTPPDSTPSTPPSFISVEVVLDVGHNPAAMEALSRRIQEQFPGRSVRVLYAMSRDKDVRTCVKHIIGVAPHSHIHFAQSKNFRAVSLEKLKEIFEEETGKQEYRHIVSENVKDMVSKVIDLAATDSAENKDGLSSIVIICGTGYIMPDARCQLGIKEPRDEDDLLRDL